MKKRSLSSPFTIIVVDCLRGLNVPRWRASIHLDGRLNVHARSCISRETPTGNYAHGETAATRVKKKSRKPVEGARQKAAHIRGKDHDDYLSTAERRQRILPTDPLLLSVSPSPSGALWSGEKAVERRDR